MPAAARMNCYCCGEPVAVNINRTNRAYYHCGHCGLSVVSKANDSTERMLNQPLNKNVVRPPTTTITATKEPTHDKPTVSPQPVVVSAAPVVQPAIVAKKKSAFKTLMDT